MLDESLLFLWLRLVALQFFFYSLLLLLLRRAITVIYLKQVNSLHEFSRNELQIEMGKEAAV